MALLGDALPGRADKAEGHDDQRPPRRGDELLRAADHERGGRGTELKDRHDSEDGLLVPEQEPLPERGEIPVWGPMLYTKTPDDNPGWTEITRRSVSSRRNRVACGCGNLGVGHGSPLP